jgi:hypothetical protein
MDITQLTPLRSLQVSVADDYHEYLENNLDPGEKLMQVYYHIATSALQ